MRLQSRVSRQHQWPLPDGSTTNWLLSGAGDKDTQKKNSAGVSTAIRTHVTQQTRAILTAQNESSLLTEESVSVEEKWLSDKHFSFRNIP
jgi:hypothetical protein